MLRCLSNPCISALRGKSDANFEPTHFKRSFILFHVLKNMASTQADAFYYCHPVFFKIIC